MNKKFTTLEEIEALPKNFLVPSDIAGYLGCAAYTINVCTRDGKNPFPFPVIRMGSRVRIPKEPFLKVMRGETVTAHVTHGGGNGGTHDHTGT